MKFSDINEALRFLSKHGDVKVDGKLVKVTRAGGLKCLSAIDFLTMNHYNIVFEDKTE